MDTTDSMRSIRNEDILPHAGKIKVKPGRGWGKGVIQDFKTTVGTHWTSELTNFNQTTVTSSCLMFLALFMPTLTIGAVYGKLTGQRIGAVETLLSQTLVGIVAPLVIGMPINIFGSTGAVLAFISVLFRMSENLKIPFLPFYSWVSIWVFLYCLVFAFFDGTRIIKIATRFTDEVFMLTIVAIFVMNSIGHPISSVGILRYFMSDHPFHGLFENDPDYDFITTALLSTILGFGTTWTIFTFKSVTSSSYCWSRKVRSIFSHFAMTVSVIIWTLAATLIFSRIEVEPLEVPDTIKPSFACCDETCKTFFPTDCPSQAQEWGTRSWFSNLSDLNGKSWVAFMAAGPAVLAFFLVFLNNCITWHLIYTPNHKLQHGEAYDYDFVLSAVFNLFCGLVGLPWLVGTSVPSLMHLNSLAEKDRDGHFILVQETRLTNLFSHLLIGACLFIFNILKFIPLPVLYGVFLFMGLSRLPDIDMWQRFVMLFMQPNKYPDTPYTMYMEKARIHMYTVFELAFFLLILIVANIPMFGIAFPFILLLCIPARLYLMPCYWKGWEICLLDGTEEEIKQWVDAKERSLFKKAIGTNHYDIDDDDEDDGDDDGYYDANPEQVDFELERGT